jgi:hypothetical protein
VTTAAASRLASRPSEVSAPLLPLVFLHIAMFAYDIAHPGRFLHVDRWEERLETILGLPAAFADGTLPSYIAAHGIVGDWLPQALIYLLGGQYAVISVQVTLTLLSIGWVRDIAKQAGLPDRQASMTAVLYALLPHTLVLPHQLASEAWFVPLVIYAFRASGALSGFAIGLATLVRPLTVLWPFVQASVPAMKPRTRALLLAAAFAPLLAWMGFVYMETGVPSMGPSSHDLGSNLYLRMSRMAAASRATETPVEFASSDSKASIGEYLHFAAAHPALMLEHSARDLFALTVKSGVERLTLDYLDLFPERRSALQNASGGWRARVERFGPAQAARQAINEEPLLVATSALGALAFVLLMSLAAVGARRWIAGRRLATREQNIHRLLIGSFVIYVFFTAQSVDAAQSRHRAPAEFALCVLAIVGWAAVRRRAQEKHLGY